jgi:hypothetical protein
VHEFWLGIDSRLGGGGPKRSTGEYEYSAARLPIVSGLVYAKGEKAELCPNGRARGEEMNGISLNDTQTLIARMAEALETHGVTIYCPWDGDLSDEEQERYEGLVAALDVVEKHYKVGVFRETVDKAIEFARDYLKPVDRYELEQGVRDALRKPLTEEESERADMHSDMRRRSES